MSYTNIGTTISVSATLPATEDDTGYAALTYTEVTGVASIPATGPSAAVVSQADLKDGVVRKAHGEVDYGGGDVQMRYVNGDAGQGILSAAFDSKANIAVKESDVDGNVTYYQAIVTSWRTAEKTTGNFKGITVGMQVTTKTVDVPV